MERTHIDVSEDTYLRQLLGRVNYVLSVDPTNQGMHEYKNWLQKMLKN
jgi:hypothetical protein